MKTSVIEVHDMLSVLSVLGVENIIGKVPGVESVTVNFAAGSATVRYDETSLKASEIKAAVHKLGAETDETGPESENNHVQDSELKASATPPPPVPSQAEAKATSPTDAPSNENAKLETPKLEDDSTEHSH